MLNETNIKDFRLKSIFTLFRNNNINEEYYYPLNINNSIIYPKLKSELGESNIDLEKLKSDLNDIDINNINSLINAIRNITSYIPYYSDGKLSYDISLYDYIKIKSAIVSSLYSDKNDSNLYNLNDNEEYFALLSADISGIQRFIYTISSKGALKSLRERSFYLEIMLEHIVDEILEEFNLSRFNLLYTGGGHFYIIIPNLDSLSKIIKDIKDKINDWFIREFSIDLYIAMDFQKFSFNDLKNTKNIFKFLSQKLSNDKQRRYNTEQLKTILMPLENKSNFECSICHTSSKNTKERDNNLGYVCDICYNLYKAGKYLANEKDNIFIVDNKNNLDKESIVKLPSIHKDSERYLYFGDNFDNIIRTYSKNNLTNKNINLYIGNYNFRKESDLISFEDLLNEAKGIKRIGVLRCDVDNLREAFRKYTNNKLTFSAGIGFFHHKYPISKMAEQTGELEELAKENKYNNIEKDSISLFGLPNKFYKENNNKFDYCFNWEEFNRVTEKINKIFSLCYFDEEDNSEETKKDKIFFSISFMYRIKQLISSSDKINIARLAYALGRIKSTGSEKYEENYNEFKNCIYNWIFDKNEIKYLNTALDLIIYLFRDDYQYKN